MQQFKKLRFFPGLESQSAQRVKFQKNNSKMKQQRQAKILIIITHSMVLFQLSNKCPPIINVVVYSIDPGHVGIELYPPVAASRFQIKSN